VSSDRLSLVLAAMADVDGDAESAVDRVCAAALALLSLKGAGLSLIVDGELRGTAGVSDPGVALVQELQLSLGEGPGVDAWRNSAAVLEPDLADPAVVRWPAFAQAGVEAGVRAVFAFPLALGAVGIGVMVLYGDRPGGLSADELAYGLVLADVATQVILGLQAGAPAGKRARRPARPRTAARRSSCTSCWPRSRRTGAEIHQATGIVSVQLGVSLDQAFVRLRARAFADGDSLRSVAREIVAGRLRLEDWG